MSLSRAFISYAHADLKYAADLKNMLTRRGMSVWMDRDQLVGGNHWRDELREAIERCDVFLLVMTPKALASAEVKHEYEAALSQGKRVIALMYKRVRRAPELLQPLQWHDCSKRRAVRGLFDLINTLNEHKLISPLPSGRFDVDLALTRVIRGDIPPAWAVLRVNAEWYRRPRAKGLLLALITLAVAVWLVNITLPIPMDPGVRFFELFVVAALVINVDAYYWLRWRYHSRLLSGAFMPELVVLTPDGFVVQETPFWGFGGENRTQGYNFAGIARLETRRTWRGRMRIVMWGLGPPRQYIVEIPRKFGEANVFSAQIVAAFERYKRGSAQPVPIQAQAPTNRQGESMG